MLLQRNLAWLVVASALWQNGVQGRPRMLSKRADGEGLALDFKLSDDDRWLLTDLEIGLPGQPMKMSWTMDLFTWVPVLITSYSRWCSDEETQVSCRIANSTGYFTPADSSTYSLQSGKIYLDPEGQLVSGQSTGQDDFHFGGVSVDQVIMGQADLFNIPPQIALAARTSSSEYVKFLDSVLESRVTNTAAYSLWIGNGGSGGTIDGRVGKVLLGLVDDSKYYNQLLRFQSNNIGHVAVTGMHYLPIGGTNATLAASDFRPGQLLAKLSLSPYLYLPDGLFNVVIGLFKADSILAAPTNENQYRMPCSSALDDSTGITHFQISIRSIVITIPIKEFFLPLDRGREQCTLAIRPISIYTDETTADIILGLPFLKGSYIVVDYTNSQTLIAPRRYDDGDERLRIVGVGNATISGTGTTFESEWSPATTTITTVLNTHGTGDNLDTDDGGDFITGGDDANGDKGNPQSSDPPEGSPSGGGGGGSGTNVGAIAGGVVGGVVFILIGVAYLLYRRRERQKDILPVDHKDLLGGIQLMDKPQRIDGDKVVGGTVEEKLTGGITRAR